MVGTPAKNVMSSSCISCRAGPASNLGSITTVLPVAALEFWITVWPNEWNSGSTQRNLSGFSGSTPKSDSARRALSRVAVPSSAPLGSRWCRRCRG